MEGDKIKLFGKERFVLVRSKFKDRYSGKCVVTGAEEKCLFIPTKDSIFSALYYFSERAFIFSIWLGYEFNTYEENKRCIAEIADIVVKWKAFSTHFSNDWPKMFQYMSTHETFDFNSVKVKDPNLIDLDEMMGFDSNDSASAAPAATPKQPVVMLDEPAVENTEMKNDAGTPDQDDDGRSPDPYGDLSAGMRGSGNAKSGEGSLFKDPVPLITHIQSLRFYFTAIDDSDELRAAWEGNLRELVKQVIIPRVNDDKLRASLSVDTLCDKALVVAEKSYEKDYETQQDYISNLDTFLHSMTDETDRAIRLALLKLFFEIGQRMSEDNSPSGSLTLQDRFLVAFLAIRIWPDMDVEGIDTNFFKAAGLIKYLTSAEKIALILYDFMVISEDNDLEIVVHDIDKAKELIVELTGDPEAENLIGGFDENWAAEMFQFYNVWVRYDQFHEMCIEIWRELRTEMSSEARKKLLSALACDFESENKRVESYLPEYKAK